MLLFLFCPVITVKGCERRLSLESGHEDASALYKPQGPSVCGSKLGRGGLWGVRSGHLGLNRATELTVKKCISEWPVLTLSHHCSLDYKEDPYSKGDPCNTICCREDLNSHNLSPGGCYDTKVMCCWVLFALFWLCWVFVVQTFSTYGEQRLLFSCSAVHFSLQWLHGLQYLQFPGSRAQALLWPMDLGAWRQVGSSWARDQTRYSTLAGGLLPTEPPGKPHPIGFWI